MCRFPHASIFLSAFVSCFASRKEICQCRVCDPAAEALAFHPPANRRSLRGFMHGEAGRALRAPIEAAAETATIASDSEKKHTCSSSAEAEHSLGVARETASAATPPLLSAAEALLERATSPRPPTAALPPARAIPPPMAPPTSLAGGRAASALPSSHAVSGDIQREATPAVEREAVTPRNAATSQLGSVNTKNMTTSQLRCEISARSVALQPCGV